MMKHGTMEVCKRHTYLRIYDCWPILQDHMDSHIAKKKKQEPNILDLEPARAMLQAVHFFAQKRH